MRSGRFALAAVLAACTAVSVAAYTPTLQTLVRVWHVWLSSLVKDSFIKIDLKFELFHFVNLVSI